MVKLESSTCTSDEAEFLVVSWNREADFVVDCNRYDSR